MNYNKQKNPFPIKSDELLSDLFRGHTLVQAIHLLNDYSSEATLPTLANIPRDKTCVWRHPERI